MLVFPLVFAASKAKSVFSPIAYIWQNDVVILNTDCQKTKTCSLKKARFWVRDYHFTVDDDDVYGSHLYAWYETDSVATLTDYVFVQLVRGCRYSSILVGGEEIFEFDYTQQIFGKNRLAVFTKWIIDSFDTDPVYNSMPGLPRHYFYRWNTSPYATQKITEKLFGKMRPTAAVLYISDIPSQGTYISQYGYAISTSFQYKMGIYRSKDVPTHTTAEDIGFATPLIEFGWKNSWIYNHETGTFQKKKDVSLVCTDPNAM